LDFLRLSPPRRPSLRRDRGWPALADAVADEADRIEAAHVLLLQEIDGIALALAEQATSTLAPVTSSRPEDWTWRMARWTTRWKPLVGDGSVAALDLERIELGVEIGATVS
jgi:transcriptional regulator of nitric oxide reductase